MKSNQTAGDPVRRAIGAVFLMVAFVAVLRVALPDTFRESGRQPAASGNAGPRVPPPRARSKDQLELAYTRVSAVLKEEIAQSEHPYTWVLGIHALGKNVESDGRPLVDAVATFVRERPGAAPNTAPLEVPKQEGTREVAPYAATVYAVLIGSSTENHPLLSATSKPLTDGELIRSVLAQAPSPRAVSEPELVWQLDALSRGVVRAPDEKLAAAARYELARLTESAFGKLEHGAQLLAPYRGRGALRDKDLEALRRAKEHHEGLFALERFGVPLTIACFRAAVALDDPAVRSRGRRLLAMSLARFSAERGVFADTEQHSIMARLEALEYFSGLAEAYMLGRRALRRDDVSAPSELFRITTHAAASDAAAIVGQLDRERYFDALASLRTEDPKEYFRAVEGLAQAARGLRAVTRGFEDLQ